MNGRQLTIFIKACGFSREVAEQIFAGNNAIALMQATAQEDRELPSDMQKSVDGFRFGVGQSMANLQQLLKPKEDGQVVLPVLVQYIDTDERPPDMTESQAEFMGLLCGLCMILLPIVRVVLFDKARFRTWMAALVVPQKDGMVAREHWARSTLESRIVVPQATDMPMGSPIVTQ